MPVIKPVYTAVATAPVASGGVVTTTVSPAITNFFSAVTAGDIAGGVTTLLAASFVDDADAPVVALPVLSADDYYNVFVNGVLQQATLSTLTPASLVLATTDIAVGVPVTLAVASFGNTVSSITTQPAISAPTVTIST